MHSPSQSTITDTRLRRDWNVRLILIIGLIVQVLYCITQSGYYHPDQHFQIIEFSSYQLSEPSDAASVWELASQIRPTLQVYLFSFFVKACRSLHVEDPYHQMTLLRLFFGLLAFAVFNAIALYHFKTNRRILYLVLLLVNFGFALPYLRTLYSSEIASAIVFYGTVLLYEKTKQNKGFGWPMLVGLIMSTAFYLRFQMAFAIAGFGVSILFFDRNYRYILPLAIGFAIGISFNCYLDYGFYHYRVFTPYRYFYENITAGRAASFGTSSFVRYVLMLTLVIGAPLLSIFLFYYSLKTVVKRYYQPMVISTLFFVIGHCLVAHKEERFMFPILNVLPVIAGFSLQSFLNYYHNSERGIRAFLNGIIGFSVVLNVFALVMIIFNPYSQTVEFSRKLKNRFENTTTMLYCINRTPFETPSKLPLVFYQRSVPNVQLVRISSADSVRHLHHAYIATTFDEVKDRLRYLDSSGLKPLLYSSSALWKINQFLQSRRKRPINDIWVLYRKE